MLYRECWHPTYRGMSLLTLAILAAGCSSLSGREHQDDPDSRQEIREPLAVELGLPGPEDWIDRGEILSAGSSGIWDHLLYGGFAASVVKKNGTFFLYYQGAGSYDESFGTVVNRAIGVATSTDGINFRKHRNSPVIRWQPNEWLEEGAVSAAPLLDASDAVWMYYGANTRADDWNVNADARLAYSTDGVIFTDVGVILDHGSSTLWGSGDELFPITAIYDCDDVLLYYLPNGAGRRGRVGVAKIRAGWEVTKSAEVLGPDSAPLHVWGMGSSVRVSLGRYVFFFNRDDETCVEARMLDTSIPERVSKPLTEYCFDDISKGTVFLDQDSNTWYFYYRSRDGLSYGVKTAAGQSRHSRHSRQLSP